MSHKISVSLNTLLVVGAMVAAMVAATIGAAPTPIPTPTVHVHEA